jgi:hypothetical protein
MKIAESTPALPAPRSSINPPGSLSLHVRGCVDALPVLLAESLQVEDRERLGRLESLAEHFL